MKNTSYTKALKAHVKKLKAMVKVIETHPQGKKALSKFVQSPIQDDVLDGIDVAGHTIEDQVVHIFAMHRANIYVDKKSDRLRLELKTATGREETFEFNKGTWWWITDPETRFTDPVCIEAYWFG